MSIDLFSGVTADGDSTVYTLDVDQTAQSIGFAAWGTWGAGTITISGSPDGGTTWLSLGTFTANNYNTFTTQMGKLKATLSGSTGANLNLRAYNMTPANTRTDS